MAVSDYLTQEQLQEMMNQRFGVPEGTPTLSQAGSPVSFQYEEEEYPSSYNKSQLYYDREGMFSPKVQTRDQDAYYENVRSLGTEGDPFIGARDRVDAPFAQQSPDYYAGDYINYDETTDRPYQGDWSWQHGYEPDPLKDREEADPMLMQALINQNRSNVYNRAPFNQRDTAGITAAAAAAPSVPVQDFRFSEYQGPSVGAEAGNINEQQEDEPWYSQMLGIAGAPFRWLNEKAKASKYYKPAPDWTPAYDQAGMPRGGGYTASDLNKMNALGGYYSEPARAHRRAKNRIENILQRRAQGKTYSDKNLEQLSGGQFDFGGGKQGSYTAPTRAAPPGMSAPSSGMHGGKHYSRGGIVSLL